MNYNNSLAPTPSPSTYTELPPTTKPLDSISTSIKVANEEVYSGKLSAGLPNLTIWNGYVFLPFNAQQNPKLKLIKVDLQTGEKTSALEIADTIEIDAKHVSVLDTEVIGDKLLVVVGAYIET